MSMIGLNLILINKIQGFKIHFLYQIQVMNTLVPIIKYSMAGETTCMFQVVCEGRLEQDGSLQTLSTWMNLIQEAMISKVSINLVYLGEGTDSEVLVDFIWLSFYWFDVLMWY